MANPTSRDTGQVVWVLGAGFSRPLGAPLLAGLLAYQPRRVADKLYPDSSNGGQDLSTQIFQAKAFCRAGMEQGLWQNAEEFLERVETAVESAEPDPVLQAWLGSGVMFQGPGDSQKAPIKFPHAAALARGARLALASDCSVFLRGASLASEKWQPYVRWAEGLTSQDTIISFNYDAIPELLESRPNAKLKVIVPNRPFQPQRTQIVEHGSALVLKVHGSTTWQCEASGRVIVERPWEEPVGSCHKRESQLLLGIPGPLKGSLYGGRLKDLWEGGLSAVREADVIVFIGYRFPESDSESRSCLLNALSENRKKKRILTVLGPSSFDTDRLRVLLEAATRGSDSSIQSLPLFAQDFLALVWTLNLLEKSCC